MHDATCRRCDARYVNLAPSGDWDQSHTLARCPECIDPERPWESAYPNMVEAPGWQRVDGVPA